MGLLNFMAPLILTYLYIFLLFENLNQLIFIKLEALNKLYQNVIWFRFPK